MILIPNAVARSWQGGKQRPFCIEYSMYVPQKPHLHATQQGSDLFFFPSFHYSQRIECVTNEATLQHKKPCRSRLLLLSFLFFFFFCLFAYFMLSLWWHCRELCTGDRANKQGGLALPSNPRSENTKGKKKRKTTIHATVNYTVENDQTQKKKKRERMRMQITLPRTNYWIAQHEPI